MKLWSKGPSERPKIAKNQQKLSKPGHFLHPRKYVAIGEIHQVRPYNLMITSLWFFHQIAGSYWGSYFSKIGLLIPKIPAAAT